MEFPFLHPAHEVRETFGALRWVSWLVIGLGAGALVLSWGRLVAWIRSPEVASHSRLRRWGEDARGYYFEVAGGRDETWSAVAPDGSLQPLSNDADGSLRLPTGSERPVALLSSGGRRLTL